MTLLITQHLESDPTEDREIPVMISLRVDGGEIVCFPGHLPIDAALDAVNGGTV